MDLSAQIATAEQALAQAMEQAKVWTEKALVFQGRLATLRELHVAPEAPLTEAASVSTGSDG